MTPLEREIHQQIYKNGPLALSEYMAVCLYHNIYGYYFNKNPIGKAGDFITAPEISPLFGEAIAFCLHEVWEKLNTPQHLTIIELGPGKGTLTKDIAYTLERLKSFSAEVRFMLIESSPLLLAYQQENLAHIKNITWPQHLKEVQSQGPVIIVANEFFDALPIDQYRLNGAILEKRFVTLQHGNLVFNWEKCKWPHPFPLPNNGIYEDRPLQRTFLNDIARLLTKNKGALLAIDYGHFTNKGGDTFQAVRDHQYVSPLQTPGLCDLTSHVNFREMEKELASQGLSTFFAGTQRAFLRKMGIDLRLSLLQQQLPPAKFQTLQQGVHRLTDESEMGDLFKVLIMSHPSIPHIDGVF